MAQLPMYQQRTRAQAPTATGADFGAGAGQALAQSGDVLAQIGERIQTRNETINRVRTMNQFEQQVQEDFVALQQSEDISDPASIEAFRNTIRERREAALSSFSGRPGTRETFRSQLENMEGQYIKNAMGEQIKAQNQIIANQSENIINTTGSLIVDDFANYDLALQNGYEQLDQLKPAMSEQMYQASRMNLERSAATSMVQALMQRGEVDQLEEFLSNGRTLKLLGTDTRLNAQSDISKVRYEREQQAAAVQGHITAVESVVGPLTKEQRDLVASMPDPSKMSIGQKMAFNQILLGRPLNDKEQRQMMNIYSAETAMTKSSAAAMVHQGAQKFMSGTMSPEERLEYDMAWQQAGLLPGWKPNDVTGRMEYVNPPLTPMLSQIRDQIMGNQPQVQRPPQTPFEFGVEAAETVSPGYRSQEQPELDYSDPANREQRDVQLNQLTQTMTQDGQGLYQMADTIAGAAPAAKEFAFNLPIVGDMFGIDPTSIEDRQFARGVVDQTVRAFAVNRRFPVAEVKRVIDAYPVGPTLRTPEAYRAYIRAIDKSVETAINTRQMALESGRVSMDNRRDMEDTIQDLKGLKAVLNVTDEDRRKPATYSPDQVKVLIESGALQPGDTFVGEDGVTRTVRGQ